MLGTLRVFRSCASLAILFAAMPWDVVRAADPIKVGFSMALTGAVAPNGKQNLLALEIWRDDVNISYGKDGEWSKSRQFFTQFQGVSGNDLAQFRDTKHQVIVWPDQYKTGDVIYPYGDAKKK